MTRFVSQEKVAVEAQSPIYNSMMVGYPNSLARVSARNPRGKGGWKDLGIHKREEI